MDEILAFQHIEARLVTHGFRETVAVHELHISVIFAAGPIR